MIFQAINLYKYLLNLLSEVIGLFSDNLSISESGHFLIITKLKIVRINSYFNYFYYLLHLLFVQLSTKNDNKQCNADKPDLPPIIPDTIFHLNVVQNLFR